MTARAGRIPVYGDALIQAAAQRPEETGLIVDGQRITNAQWLARAKRALGALQATDCKRGDRIGVYMPNCVEYLEIVLGAMLGGMVPVTLNSRYLGHELGYVINDSGIRILFTTAAVDDIVDFRARVSSALDSIQGSAEHLLETVVVVEDDDSDGRTRVGYVPWLARANEPELAKVEINDLALMMYTSGTTAQPKGCLISHRAIMGNAAAMVERWHMTCEDRFWDPLPFFHMSTILPLAACLLSGATFIGTQHFDVDAAARCLSDEKITIAFPAFPTIMTALLQHPSISSADLSALRLVNNVAPPDTLKAFQAALPSHTRQVSAYGLTEAGGVVSFGAPEADLETRTTTCGKPFPGIAVRIVNPNTGAVLGADQVGEIQIRGYCLLDHYHNAPQATERAMTEGWLRTGDLGLLTQTGEIRYTGRLKDMLKVGGENVAALEIEALYNSHPDVILSQVIGVADERLMEVPALFVQCREDDRPDAQTLIDYGCERISRFKVPRYVVYVDEWPMSATKIQKFKLKEMPLGRRYRGSG